MTPTIFRTPSASVVNKNHTDIRVLTKGGKHNLIHSRSLTSDEFNNKGKSTNRTSTGLRKKRILPMCDDEDEVVVDIGGGRRWQYQVYRGRDNDAQDQIYSESNHFNGHFHAIDLAPQKNPLHLNNNSNSDCNLNLKSHHELSQSDESWVQNGQSAESGSDIAITAPQAKVGAKNKRVPTKPDEQLATTDDHLKKSKIHPLLWPRLYPILLCFSLVKNARFIFGIHRNQKFNRDNDCCSLAVLDGLKTLTMIWIIFGATIQSINNSDMMGNLFQMGEMSCSSRLMQALLNTSLAVETLFVISGITTIISLVRRSQGELKFIDIKNNSAFEASKDNSRMRGGDSRPRQRLITMSGKRVMIGRASVGLASQSTCSTLMDHLLSSSTTTSAATMTPSSISSSGSRVSSNFQAAKGDGTQMKNPTQKDDAAGECEHDFKLITYQPLLWLSLRYLRLAPTYAITICLVILLPQLSSGPFWLESMDHLAPENCRSNWFLNLLFVNNHFEDGKIATTAKTTSLCLSHSWSLSNEMQFYLFSLITFGLYYHSMKRSALLLWLTTFAASTATNHALTIIHQFPPNLLPTIPNNMNHFDGNNNQHHGFNMHNKDVGASYASNNGANLELIAYKELLYNKPWPHLPSYLIGLIIGFSLLRHTSDSWTLSLGWRVTGWLLSSLVALSLINSLYPWNLGLPVDSTLTAIYASTHRSLWAICLSWFIYELATRSQAPLARFLNWSGFQLSARLTYCCYLIYPIIIRARLGLLRERLDFSISSLAGLFVANVALAYLAASFLSLLVDAPILQLRKLAIQAITREESSPHEAERAGVKSKRGSDKIDCERPSSLDSGWTLASANSSLDSGSLNRREGGSPARSHTGILHNKSDGMIYHRVPDKRKRVRIGDAIIKAHHQQEQRHQRIQIQTIKPTSKNHNVSNEIDSSFNDQDYTSNRPIAPRIARNTHNRGHNKPLCKSPSDEHRSAEGYNQIYESSVLLSMLSPSRLESGNDISNRILTDSCSPDPDFQQKLARAISRGFKLRNQIAMASRPNYYQHQHQVEQEQQQQQQQQQPSANTNPINLAGNLSTFGRSLQRKKQQIPRHSTRAYDEQSTSSTNIQSTGPIVDGTLDRNSRSSNQRGYLTTFQSVNQQMSDQLDSK